VLVRFLVDDDVAERARARRFPERAAEAHRRCPGDRADHVSRERALRCGCDAVTTLEGVLQSEPGLVAP
jgi:hypothetical protein